MSQNKIKENADRLEGRVPTDDEAMTLFDHDLRAAVSDVIAGLHSLDMSSVGGKNKAQIARVSTSATLALRLLDAKQGYWPSAQYSNSDKPAAQVDINKLLQQIEIRWQGRVAAKGLLLSVNLEVQDDFYLNCDELDLQRLLSNLFENAVKFTDHGQILVAARQTPQSILFSVSDQGPGFSPEAMAKLFAFGGRPKDSPKPGSGLGLFIAKQIVDRLDGRITVSNINSGAMVEVEIPISAGIKHISQPNKKDKHFYQRLAGQRVLLAEDNKTNQLVASQMLHALGAEVTIANDGIEAWELLQERVFDICLLDVEMPRKSGLELLSDIRASNATFATMPLIVVTAYVMREHLQRIQQAGADGIIAKPLISIETFGEMIQSYCRNVGYEFAPPILNADNGPVNKQTYDALRDTVGSAVFADLLSKLLIDLEDVETRLRHAFKEKKIVQVGIASHNLISLAGAIGAAELLKSARALNAAVDNEKYEKMTVIENDTLERLMELTGFLQTAHQELAGT